MRPRVIVRSAIVAVATTMATAATADASPSVDRLCHAPSKLLRARGSTTVVRAPHGTTLACYHGRRPIVLAPSEQDFTIPADSASVLLTFDGPWIGWVKRIRGGREPGDQATVCNLSTHRGVTLDRVLSERERVIAFLLNHSGAVWFVRGNPATKSYIVAADRQGARIVATGGGVQTHSIALGSLGAFWLDGDGAHFQALTGGASRPTGVASQRSCRPITVAHGF